MLVNAKRFKDDGNTTLSLMFIDGCFENFGLEDEGRAIKVQGETRIPESTYPVKFKEVLTPMTERYRKKFDWFEWHLEICDIDNFTNVYIHYGNKETDTAGCYLTGSTVDMDSMFQGRSIDAYKKVYKKIGDALRRGEPVHMKFEDI